MKKSFITLGPDLEPFRKGFDQSELPCKLIHRTLTLHTCNQYKASDAFI